MRSSYRLRRERHVLHYTRAPLAPPAIQGYLVVAEAARDLKTFSRSTRKRVPRASCCFFPLYRPGSAKEWGKRRLSRPQALSRAAVAEQVEGCPGPRVSRRLAEDCLTPSGWVRNRHFRPGWPCWHRGCWRCRRRRRVSLPGSGLRQFAAAGRSLGRMTTARPLPR